MTSTATRERVAFDGAARLLDEIAAHARVAASSADARRSIGELVREQSGSCELGAVREATRRTGRSVVVAERSDGPVIAARWFEAGVPTTIHDHGTWGVAVVVEGDQAYEEWAITPSGQVRLVEERHLAAGDISHWGPPPHDIHRQQGVRGGALELIVIGEPPRDPVDFEPAGPLEGAVDAVRRYDLAALHALYRADVVLDANVPQWRFQLQGSDTVINALSAEIAHAHGLRIASSRLSRGAGVRIVELEARFDYGDPWREAHLLRGDDDGIVEHTIHCSGVWDAATIARQAGEAPMVWR